MEGKYRKHHMLQNQLDRKEKYGAGSSEPQTTKRKRAIEVAA